MKKRGQLSIFLILAIILIIIISITFSLNTSLKFQSKKNEIIKSSKADSLRLDIQSCLTNTLNSAVSILSLQGGYIEKPNKFLTIKNSIISFGYYKDSVILNSIEGLKSEINKYITENLPLCINTQENKRLISEIGSITVKTTITEDKVRVEVSYPIRIKQGGRIENLNENYEAELKVRLGYIYNFVLDIAAKHLKDPRNIDIANLLKPDLLIDIVGYKNNILIYAITDKKSTINNKPLIFILANYFGT